MGQFGQLEQVHLQLGLANPELTENNIALHQPNK